jgi:hypothetical protein
MLVSAATAFRLTVEIAKTPNTFSVTALSSALAA